MPITKLTPETQPSLSDDRLAALLALLPEAVADGKLNWEALREMLAGQLEDEASEAAGKPHDEHFGLFWPGKRAARREAASPAKAGLHPAPGEGVDEANTRNLYLEGDNLSVLKLLRKAYSGRVKMIYIDPPYNTGNDFVYKDNFAESSEAYLRRSGQADASGQRLVSNPKAGGRFHSNWLNMIYPRLLLARELLRDDGVIFVSIDDNEMHHLRMVMDEIFGAENWLGTLIWDLPRGINADIIARAHEYVLCFSKFRPFISHFARTNENKDSIERCNKNVDIRHPASEIRFKSGIRYEGKDQTLQGKIGGNEWIEIDGKLEFKNGRLAKDVTLRAGWTMKDMIIKWMNGEDIVDLKGQKIKEFFLRKMENYTHQKNSMFNH